MTDPARSTGLRSRLGSLRRAPRTESAAVRPTPRRFTRQSQDPHRPLRSRGDRRRRLLVPGGLLLREPIPREALAVEGEDAIGARLGAVRSEYAGSERVGRSVEMIDGWGTLIGTWGLRPYGRRATE